MKPEPPGIQMTPQRRETQKWINLCAIIAAIVVGFYLLTPPSKPQREFTYQGKTYTLKNTQSERQQITPRTPEQEQQAREFRERCHMVIRFRSGAYLKCN